MRRWAPVLGALCLMAAAGRALAADPDFDAVAWTAIGCASADLVRHSTPASVDLAGDATFPAIYVAHDDRYVYFRYRLDGSPAGPGGFKSYSWTALMQVPSGNPFQYQFQLSLDGTGDRIEVWANTDAQDIEFSPLFHDDSEVRLFTMPYDATGGAIGNTTPLARTLVAADGSSFGGDADYFLDFAVPVAVLVAEGVVADAAELDEATYFPATSTNPNNYNKSALNCAFLPAASLSIEVAVAPAVLPAGVSTQLASTLTVANSGPAVARGVVLAAGTLPAWVAGTVATVASSDPAVTWIVVSTNPLELRASHLPVGATLEVTLTGEATPDCASADATVAASVYASNAVEAADAAVAAVGRSCDDGNGCTTDACEAGTCTHAPVADCVPCASGADCTDGDACTTDVCNGDGVCEHAAVAGCPACTDDAACADADPCTDGVCGADGSCAVTVTPGCVPCAADADCDDGDACTADACAGGVCAATAIPDCTPPAEQCGNCTDDDGDGLVDYEDPDCCAAGVLDVRRMRLNPEPARRRGNRLRVRVRDAGLAADALDPMSQETTLQISDADGTLFCHTIPAGRWKHPRRRVFRFKDRAGEFAGGLAKGTLKIRRDGRVVFATKGRRMTLPPSAGEDVRLTLRVGGQCAQAALGLRATRNVRRGLVFP